MGRKKTGANKGLKCRCLRQRQLKKFKNQMPLSKTTVIESNSNPQFVIVAFELLKEKKLSRTTTFAKHTSLGISLDEKLNSSFFPPQTLFRSKTPSLHISCRNQAKLYFLMNEMTIDLNMLNSFMEHRI